MQANTLRITPTGLALDPIKTPVLYRAFSDLSATTFSFDSGFQASLREWPARVAPSQFTTYLKRHLDWRNRLPSPFISLRSSWDETVAFAEAMLTNQYFSHKNVRIAYIDVQKLIDCGVEIPGDVEKIIERLDNIIYTEWCRYSDGRDLREFITTDHICVGHIPLECIILVEELAYSPDEPGRLILRPVTRDGKSAMCEYLSPPMSR